LRFIQRCWWLPILLLAVLIRFYHLAAPAIWYDEAFSYVMTTNSPALLWSIAAKDIHPPLYYFVLKGWTAVFGSEVFSIRAMSATAGVITVGLGVWLARLVANRRAAVLAGLLLAMLPIAVRYSQEVRMYALLGVWMTGATLALVYWVKGTQRHRYLLIYAVLIAAGLYTHYFACLGVMVHWLYLITLHRSRSPPCSRLVLRPAWWLANVGAGVLFLPWVPAFVSQLSRTGNVNWIPLVSIHSIPSAFWQYLMLDDGLGLPGGLYWGLVLAIVVMCAYTLCRDFSAQRFNTLLVVALWAPLLVVGVASLKMALFVPRYFLFSAVGLPVLLGIGLDQLARTACWLAVLLFMVIIGIESVGIYNVYSQKSNLNDTARHAVVRVDVIAEAINSQYKVGDQIAVLNYYWYLSVLYYNSTGIRPLLYSPAPGIGSFECKMYCRFDAPFDASSNDFYIERLDVLPAGTTRVWLVDDTADSDVGLTIPCRWQLRDTLAAGDTRVRLYEVNAVQASPNEQTCIAP